MKQVSTTKRMKFQCKPEVHEFLQAAQRDLYRGQSSQINVCLEILFGLRDERDSCTKEFRLWLDEYQANGHQPVNMPRLKVQQYRERREQQIEGIVKAEVHRQLPQFSLTH